MARSEVLVSGAGPVGLFTAHSLVQAGVPVRIVDTGIWGCAHSYALALHPGSAALLRKSGIQIDERCAVRTVALYDEKQRRADIRLETPMLIVPQSLLEGQLEYALAAEGVNVQWRHKVMNVAAGADAVTVSLNRYEKESVGYVVSRSEWVVDKSWTEEFPVVIGADGYSSAVRRSLGFAFPEVGPCAWYGVFEFQSDADIGGEVRIVLGERSADVLWPLGDGWFRWGFELPDYQSAEDARLARYRARFGEPTDRVKDRFDSTVGDINSLPDETLQPLISKRAPWFRGSIEDIGWRTAIRFERRLASGFGKDRCWIVGDAAHLAGPIGVQSLNVGLAEAADLSKAVAARVRGGDPAALTEWERRYMTEWRRLQSVHDDFALHGDVNDWVWANRARILPALPAWGPDLDRLAAGLGLKPGSATTAASGV
jgi:2-polyprenyl-6-methoxyphenol hydroxylase-like FAD-dependent oxidoreductase